MQGRQFSIVRKIIVVADAASVGLDAGSIRHVRTLIFRTMLTFDDTDHNVFRDWKCG